MLFLTNAIKLMFYTKPYKQGRKRKKKKIRIFLNFLILGENPSYQLYMIVQVYSSNEHYCIQQYDLLLLIARLNDDDCFGFC